MLGLMEKILSNHPLWHTYVQAMQQYTFPLTNTGIDNTNSYSSYTHT